MKSWITWLSFSCCTAFGQQPSDKIAFEVASIKSSAPLPMGQIRTGMNADAGMLRYTNVSLKDCIRVAYRVKDFQVQGPDWIGNTRFDIVAKLPAGSSQDHIPEMLQALLADRFKLTLQRDTKEHAIYALVVAKGGPKLKPAEVPTGDGAVAGANSGRGAIPRGAVSMRMDPAGMHLQAPSVTLATLGEMISRFSERPIVDMTGIQGQYDFDLVFLPETTRGMPAAARGAMPPPPPGESGRPPSDAQAEGAGSIYDSVQRYGLKLEPRKAPMEVLVVDHIERTPTEN
jgi:uncharacterized protein (TIGR03435 family)